MFVSWAPFSRRTETLARLFDLAPEFVAGRWDKRPLLAPLKYPGQALRTAARLVQERPAAVWVMDPPLPAVVVASLYALARRLPLVVDVHTVDFYAPKWRVLRPLERPLLRRADAVVVTNDSLAARVRQWGCSACVLPDPVPTPAPDGGGGGVRPDVVTVVATYSDDEPIALLPAVARRLPGVRLFVTGTPRISTDDWPANLVPTGFLDDASYWGQLRSSAVVVVLTTRPDTLLSGGYEALALGRPLVVSDHRVLREYFADAAVYARTTAESLSAAVTDALARGDELHEAAGLLAARRTHEWEAAARPLRDLTGRAP
jgi:glycosyltransferase involved in cell wall biosynthesis